jgi:hypothetical protein
VSVVDVERLMSGWLRTRDAVTDLVEQRVYTAIPKDPTFPLVRLTLIDERTVFPRPRYLTSSLIQIDCYGGPKVDARAAADAVCDELTEHFTGSHDAGVVSAVDCSTRYLPDTTYDPAKPRYVVDVTVHSHP